MASGSYYQADVRCPYYKEDNGRNRIVCEGIIPGSVTNSFFSSRQLYKTQIKNYCCNQYWRCEICTANDDKYKED